MSRKLSQNFVKNELKKESLKLLSEYFGAKKEIIIQCSQGHIYSGTWDAFKQGRRCPHCAGNAKKPIKKLKWL
jgi:hypothetical protein